MLALVKSLSQLLCHHLTRGCQECERRRRRSEESCVNATRSTDGNVLSLRVWSLNVSQVAGRRSVLGEWCLRVFVGLDTKDNVLVGAAPRLLAQQQPRGQAGRLARDGHVVRPPRLAVLVHHSQTPAGGAVPDALLRPVGRRTEDVNVASGGRERTE